MLIPSLMLIAAIAVLYFGAEFSLDSSEKIGKRIGMSPLMVGMLLIGFGTSLPEMFVGHIAGVQGKLDIAVGSLIGSNIANMFLILGISGLVVKMDISNRGLRDQLIVHFALGLIIWFVLTREVLSIVTVLPLLILCCVYLYMLFVGMKKSAGEHKDLEEEFNTTSVIIKLFLGFIMLYIGGELLVKAGVELCLKLGISEYIVSAIFIAFGTSFPELVTSLMAAVKKKSTDMIVGNIIGSNLFNCAFILASLGIYNFQITNTYHYEIISLLFGAAILLILSFMGRSMYRLTGSVFLVSYFVMVGHWLKYF